MDKFRILLLLWYVFRVRRLSETTINQLETRNKTRSVTLEKLGVSSSLELTNQTGRPLDRCRACNRRLKANERRRSTRQCKSNMIVFVVVAVIVVVLVVAKIVGLDAPFERYIKRIIKERDALYMQYKRNVNLTNK
uniref:Uncharacterized protein n=1 Tax=Glossina brevipalpis TaxID=37001 RepID=A0A1A9W3C3_9MUSC